MATPVDTTEQFLAIFTSLEFPSYDHFNSKLEEFQQATGSLFRKFSTHALATENKKRRRQIPSHFQYASIKLCCVHYGQPRHRSTGMRATQQYLAKGCKAIIALKFNVSKNSLCVTSYQLVHTNHALSPEYLPRYARRRQLNPDEMQRVEELVKQKPGNKQLKFYIHQEFNKQVTLRDIRNLKTRLKAGKVSRKACRAIPRAAAAGARPPALDSREKHCRAADISQRLQHILSNSAAEVFQQRVDWLEQQIYYWQQGDEMEILDQIARPSTSHELVVGQAFPAVRAAFSDLGAAARAEDSASTSPSLPDDASSYWPLPEHSDHSYCCPRTTPPPSPCRPSSQRCVTVRAPAVPEHCGGAHSQPQAFPRTPRREEAAQSLLQLSGCRPAYANQRASPKGSKAAASKNTQRGRNRR